MGRDVSNPPDRHKAILRARASWAQNVAYKFGRGWQMWAKAEKAEGSYEAGIKCPPRATGITCEAKAKPCKP